MKKVLLLITIAFIIGTPAINAQTVETVLDSSDFIIDYLVVGPDGNVYHANRGNMIHRITPDGETSLYATSPTIGFVTGMAFDSQGILYVTSGATSSIHKVTPDGNVTPFVGGFSDFPVGLETDSEDNLYVTLWNSGAVSRITPDGNMTTYATGIDTGAVDVVFDEFGNLFTANFLTGDIFKTTPDGTTIMIGSINTVAGYMTYASGHLYVSGYTSNYIYQVSPEGDVVEYAGTGEAGAVDGALATSQWNTPNGIAATASGDTIYISHDGDGKLRRIVGINTPTAIETVSELVPAKIELFQNFPNPFNPETTIRYSITNASAVQIIIYDIAGRKVATLVEEFQAPGVYETKMDASHLASGTYFYQLKAGNFNQTRRMQLLK